MSTTTTSFIPQLPLRMDYSVMTQRRFVDDRSDFSKAACTMVHSAVHEFGLAPPLKALRRTVGTTFQAIAEDRNEDDEDSSSSGGSYDSCYSWVDESVSQTRDRPVRCRHPIELSV